jgi:hypothetical protein
VIHIRIPILALAIAFTARFASLPAHADLNFEIQSVTAHPGDTNDAFDIVLQNTGPSAVNIAQWLFTIQTTSPDVTFEAGFAVTAEPYIFGADSFDGSIRGSLSSTTAPGQSLTASDMTFLSDNVSVAANSTVGLSLVLFDVAPGAAVGPVTVSFETDLAHSSLSDVAGSNINIDNFGTGTIDITSAATVPEPSTLLLLAFGILPALYGWQMRKRRNVVPNAKA